MHKYIELSIDLTNTYIQYKDAAPQIREIMCLKALYPRGLKKMRTGDLLAGRCDMNPRSNYLNFPIVFHPKKERQVAYFCSIPALKSLAAEVPEAAKKIEWMIDFWKKESTFVKIREEAPQEIKEYLFQQGIGLDDESYMLKIKPGRPKGSGFISGSFDTRAAGIIANFDNLLPLGIPGLYKRIEEFEKTNGKNAFYEAARLGLELVCDTLEYYRIQAEKLAEVADKKYQKRHAETARILADLQKREPRSLKEALQLALIFILLCGLDDFGRLDVYFGDYLARDLDSGAITEEEATQQIMAFWNFINESCSPYDARVIIGGKGRRNEKNADRFALLAMEASRRLHQIKPVLTLRLYDGQNPALFEKGLELIAEGCIYPTLYNDDANIPGFMESMDMPFEDAADYIPLGCGEIVIAGKSIGSPNSTFRILKALEAVLHNGCDGASGDLIGIKTGELEELDTFEKLYNALLQQLDARLRIDIKVHAWYKKITMREAGFVLPSLLMDGCLEKGADIFHGGIKYFGCNLEGFGLTNTINSLAVIKKYVYDEKRFTLAELVAMLDADFLGYEEERKLFLSVDKFGNNKSWVDDMKLPIEAFINERANQYAKENNLHYCTVASVNPGGIIIGPATAASADGRKCAKPFALANSPMPGTDVSGLTAMLLSAAKANPANGGYVTNINLSRETLINHREKISDLLNAYFKIGGLQLNINCFAKGDLEKALKNPQKYRNLIVRVSGYSARFIDLDETTQKHIMERTLY